MKRELLEAKMRLISGIKRLEDMRGVWPDASISIDAVLDYEIRPVLEKLDYLLSVQA